MGLDAAGGREELKAPKDWCRIQYMLLLRDPPGRALRGAALSRSPVSPVFRGEGVVKGCSQQQQGGCLYGRE